MLKQTLSEKEKRKLWEEKRELESQFSNINGLQIYLVSCYLLESKDAISLIYFFNSLLRDDDALVLSPPFV